MLLKIALLVAAVLVLIVVLAAFKPANCHVVRSVVVHAPAATIYPEIVELRRMAAWSPYEKLDPSMARSYSGPPRGVGARYAWSGNAKVGEGNISISQADPDRRVEMTLQMIRPMAGTNHVVFSLDPVTDGTRVTWEMSGKVHPIARVISVFLSMDKMIGSEFEKGLNSLKTQVEGSVSPANRVTAN